MLTFSFKKLQYAKIPHIVNQEEESGRLVSNCTVDERETDQGGGIDGGRKERRN